MYAGVFGMTPLPCYREYVHLKESEGFVASKINNFKSIVCAQWMLFLQYCVYMEEKVISNITCGKEVIMSFINNYLYYQ